MSLTKSATAQRRLSLLAGSALIAAGLTAGAAVFAPTAAWAVNECGNPGANGAAADDFTCPTGNQTANGFTHSSNGHLTLRMPASSSNTTVGANGITTIGNGADNLTWDGSSYSGSISGTGPTTMNFTTVTGDMTFSFARNVSNSNAAGTALSAVSSGGGDITVDIDNASLTGPRRGLFAETNGAGAIVIDVHGDATIRSTGNNSIAALEAVTANGDITVNLGGADGFGRIRTDSGWGIITDTDGVATINLLSNGSGFQPSGQGAILARGNAIVINVSGQQASIRGHTTLGRAPTVGGFNAQNFDFSALTGHAEIHVAEFGAWETGAATSVFSPGDDIVTVAAGGLINTPFSVSGSLSFTVDFGAGDDTVTNAGDLYISTTFQNPLNVNRGGYEAQLTFNNLETFENSGTIWLGAIFSSGGQGQFLGVDAHDDILAMPGANLVGLDGNRIVISVNLNATAAAGQTACDASLRLPNGDLPAADCIDLRGGTASGRNLLEIHSTVPGRGAYNPEGIVIVDVSGGPGGEPDAFGIAPTSPFYSPLGGGVVDKGLFTYAMGYDADEQMYKLYGVQSEATFQFPLLAHAANDLWRTTSGGWFERAADQRDVDLDPGLGGGAWMRASMRQAKRDAMVSVPLGVNTLDYDNSYTQDQTAITLGLDLIERSEGDTAFVVGLMAGYGRGRLHFDESANTSTMTGFNGGLYGSFTTGQFFVDGVVSGAWTDVDFDVPAMQLFPETTILDTDVQVIGGRVETGWRMQLSDVLRIEPLAGITYQAAKVTQLSVPADDPALSGGEVTWEDAKSLRGSLGLRASAEDFVRVAPVTRVSLTARQVQEFEGDSLVSIANIGGIDAPANDTLDGGFTEVALALTLANFRQTVAGYLNLGGTFADQYEASSVSAGFRLTW